MTSGLNYDDGRTEMRPWTQVGEHKDGRCSIWRKRNKLGRGGGSEIVSLNGGPKSNVFSACKDV